MLTLIRINSETKADAGINSYKMGRNYYAMGFYVSLSRKEKRPRTRNYHKAESYASIIV